MCICCFHLRNANLRILLVPSLRKATEEHSQPFCKLVASADASQLLSAIVP